MHRTIIKHYLICNIITANRQSNSSARMQAVWTIFRLSSSSAQTTTNISIGNCCVGPMRLLPKQCKRTCAFAICDKILLSVDWPMHPFRPPNTCEYTCTHLTSEWNHRRQWETKIVHLCDLESVLNAGTINVTLSSLHAEWSLQWPHTPLALRQSTHHKETNTI